MISGPYPETSLKAIAKTIRDDLLSRGIDKIEIFGGRNEEIWVEVSPVILRQTNLTLADIAERIASISQDIPSGDIGSGERQVRSLGLIKNAAGISQIEVKALDDGRKLKLQDIANVNEAFAEGGQTASRLGNTAIELHIQRASSADALEVANLVQSYLSTAAPSLPSNLKIEQYDQSSRLIEERIALLLRNGLTGLIFVILILFVFLSGRLAFGLCWVFPYHCWPLFRSCFFPIKV